MQKELIFGTSNRAKIDQIQAALGDANIIVRGINEFDIQIDVVEDGATAQENAKKKAIAYAKAIGRTVFAMDNALYFNGIDDSEQPGVFVRRLGGIERSSDEEMINSYTGFIEKHGKRLDGWWDFGVSIANANGTSVEDSIISPRLFVSEASKRVVPGYPLESIQIDKDTGKYISEMNSREQALFWQKNIGDQLKEFVGANL